MIFDSVYDIYRGVITYIRVDRRQDHPARADPDDVHPRRPRTARGRRHLAGTDARPGLGVGEVGYLITGVKDVRQSKVGDTITSAAKGATVPLGGYREPGRWSTPGCTRWTARTTRCCATRWTSCGSTTPR